ncbi:hypothetical protein F5X96DRAFT_643002 [Biscogniauxia mediterranea]|nr:hypothetical protein F5X96DRAFT_643002 [Biscogniauxia mediterranea]
MLSKAMSPHKFRTRLVVSALFGFSFLCFYYLSTREAALPFLEPPTARICPEPRLQSDVLLVVRTGATEILEKLPIHFQTILTCVSDYIVYSDLEEDINGHHVYNVLDYANHSVEASTPEFELYNRLQTTGREGLDYKTLFGSGPEGAEENLGWKLDKWKFLPMIDRAVRHRPKAKWFVFVESDTYIIWENMLKYLSKFDAKQPHYLGKHMYIGDVLFAHGGSGFALSKPAADKVVDNWIRNREAWDQYTKESWAGDMVLGKALKDVGVDLFWAFPHLQGDSLNTIDWNVSKLDREPWCFVPATFHHTTKPETEMLWEFEQEWHRRNFRSGATLRFRDIFKGLIYPQLRPHRGDWDNISTGTKYSDEALKALSDEDRASLSLAEKEAHFSFEKCRVVCESIFTCIQFSYVRGECSISNELRLGRAADSQCLEYSDAAGRCIKSGGKEGKDDTNLQDIGFVQSGWIMDRVSDYVQELDLSCDSPEGNSWVT